MDGLGVFVKACVRKGVWMSSELDSGHGAYGR